MAKRNEIKVGFEAPKLPTFELNKWRLLPAVSYWKGGDGKPEHSVNIRVVADGEYMVLVVKGDIEDHQHATRRFQESVVDAMEVAEGLLGRGHRWTLSSFLEFASKDKNNTTALVASIHALGGEVVLSALASPLTPLKDKRSSRDKVDTVLSNHAHDVTKHKSIAAAMRATPAALRRVAKTARCECTDIELPKGRHGKKGS